VRRKTINVIKGARMEARAPILHPDFGALGAPGGLAVQKLYSQAANTEAIVASLAPYFVVQQIGMLRRFEFH
jgi:hypothetical protein